MTRICEKSGEFSLSLMIKICFCWSFPEYIWQIVSCSYWPWLLSQSTAVRFVALVAVENAIRHPRDVGAVALFAINNGLRLSTPHLAAVGGSILQGLCGKRASSHAPAHTRKSSQFARGSYWSHATGHLMHKLVSDQQ